MSHRGEIIVAETPAERRFRRVQAVLSADLLTMIDTLKDEVIRRHGPPPDTFIGSMSGLATKAESGEEARVRTGWQGMADDVDRLLIDGVPNITDGSAVSAGTQHALAIMEGSTWAARLARDAVRSYHRESSTARGEAPFVRSGPEVGRNEPCPCGSGKKRKRCGCKGSK